MSDEMNEIRRQSKAKQEELAKSYPPHVILACATPGCKNTITFENKSEMEKHWKKENPTARNVLGKD